MHYVTLRAENCALNFASSLCCTLFILLHIHFLGDALKYRLESGMEYSLQKVVGLD